MKMFEKSFIGIKDYKKKPIHEGDIMQWPESKEVLGVVRYEPEGCQFRIQFEFSQSCHVGINVGKKGKAKVIGSVYTHPELVSWAI